LIRFAGIFIWVVSDLICAIDHFISSADYFGLAAYDFEWVYYVFNIGVIDFISADIDFI
jgi:hypothetical protein